jgi:hypothetical protein
MPSFPRKNLKARSGAEGSFQQRSPRLLRLMAWNEMFSRTANSLSPNQRRLIEQMRNLAEGTEVAPAEVNAAETEACEQRRCCRSIVG